MPKLKPSDLQIRRAVVRAELRKNMELEMLSGKQAAKKINMAESTYCGRLRETETIRLEELWRMAKEKMRKRKKRMSIQRRIGVALMLAGFMLLALSEEPYLSDVISTGSFLVRAAWAVMLTAGGYSLYRPWVEPEGE